MACDYPGFVQHRSRQGFVSHETGFSIPEVKSQIQKTAKRVRGLFVACKCMAVCRVEIMTQYEKLDERVKKLTSKGYEVIMRRDNGRTTELCVLFRSPFSLHYLYATAGGLMEKDFQIQPPRNRRVV